MDPWTIGLLAALAFGIGMVYVTAFALCRIAAEADAQAALTAVCHYCTRPAMPDSTLCGFCLDWEAACNLSESEFDGFIYGWYVESKMIDWGWTEAEIAEQRRRLQTA